jgi:polyhydroxybutyrate depolymerase
MCYLLASELSDRIAAIAPVSGPMGTEKCSPKRPVSVIHFHGTDDQYAPFKGGKGDRSLASINFYSVDHSIRAWVKANGCPEKPVVTDLPDKADDGMTVRRKTYGPGRDGAEVVLVEIEGGGHTWPGRDPVVRFLGKSTKDISANDLMWEFFKKHPMRQERRSDGSARRKPSRRACVRRLATASPTAEPAAVTTGASTQRTDLAGTPPSSNAARNTASPPV